MTVKGMQGRCDCDDQKPYTPRNKLVQRCCTCDGIVRDSTPMEMIEEMGGCGITKGKFGWAVARSTGPIDTLYVTDESTLEDAIRALYKKWKAQA